MPDLAYNLLFFVHIVSIAFLLVPSTLHLLTGGLLTNADAATVGRFTDLSSRAGRYFAAPAGGLALITGLIMVGAGGSSRGYLGFDKFWVWGSIILYIITAVVGSVLVARVGRQVSAVLASNSSNFRSNPEYAALNSRLSSFEYLSLALWLVITALMVFKPGA